MDNLATQYYFRQGCDGTHNFPYAVAISPLAGQFVSQHLSVAVEYKYLSTDQAPVPHSYPDISRWELQITGELNPSFQKDVISRLNDEQVPLAIQNNIVPLISNHVMCQPTSSVELYAWIEIYISDYEDEEVVFNAEERETMCYLLGRVSIGCSHIFHGDCIVTWLETACVLYVVVNYVKSRSNVVHEKHVLYSRRKKTLPEIIQVEESLVVM